MLPTSITWPVVAIIFMLLAGATFLGYEHDVSAGFVGTVYGAVASGALVGHFTTQGSNNG